MAGRLELSIVTPEKVSWEGPVESLVIPAYDGLLGILPGHAPLLAELAPGIVHIRTPEEEKTLAVSGGFVEVAKNKVSLFAETAELAEEISEERARQAADRAKRALREATEEPGAVANAQAALLRALARMKAAEWSRHRKPRSPHQS